MKTPLYGAFLINLEGSKLQKDNRNYTIAGTDIEEVKRQNAQSGLSYNEVLKLLAKTGGYNTKQFTNTNIDEVKNNIHQRIN